MNQMHKFQLLMRQDVDGIRTQISGTILRPLLLECAPKCMHACMRDLILFFLATAVNRRIDLIMEALKE